MLDKDGGCTVSIMSTVTWVTVFPDIGRMPKCQLNRLNYHKAYFATAVTSERHQSVFLGKLYQSIRPPDPHMIKQVTLKNPALSTLGCLTLGFGLPQRRAGVSVSF